MVSAIPDGYRSVNLFLALADAERAIAFYRRALGAEEVYRLTLPDGSIAHAELRIGDTRIMVAEERAEWGNRSARTMGGSPIDLCLYTADVEAAAARFVEAGGKPLRPVEDQFYGHRSGQFEDPEGYRWTLAQQIEVLSPEEMQRRMDAMGGE